MLYHVSGFVLPRFGAVVSNCPERKYMSEIWSDVSTRYLNGGLFGGILFKLFIATVLSLVSVFSINTFAYSSSGDFPKGPDAVLTPGVPCDHPDSYRYPEKVPYCKRNVSPELKQAIFVAYDQLGFRTGQMQRGDFKIDHYIPLCMGGANDEKNLWPQHKTVYEITDPLEPLLCDKMAAGVLSQKKAIEYITYGKNHLDEIPRVINEVNKL